MSPGRALPQLLVLVLLNLLLATGVVHGSSVVLYKSFSPAVLVKDRECNVSITIFNTGDQVLRNIALSDNVLYVCSFPDPFLSIPYLFFLYISLV